MQDKTAKQSLIVFFGLTGSGKSYLAERWAKAKGYPYHNSDTVRKELAGVGVSSRHHVPFNEGLYSPEMTSRTYDEILKRALNDLNNGATGVVLDGSYGRDSQRNFIVEALSTRCKITFILCHCSETVTKERFTQRGNDHQAVSDGRWEIYTGQIRSFSYPQRIEGTHLLKLNTDYPVKNLIEQVDAYIDKTGHGRS